MAEQTAQPASCSTCSTWGPRARTHGGSAPSGRPTWSTWSREAEQLNAQSFARSIDPERVALALAGEAKPGWAFRQVGGSGLWVAVTPWPEYGEAGKPVWMVRVVRCGAGPTRRYGLKWSSRLRRWAIGDGCARLQRDASLEDLRALDNFMLDTLEGALC
jgi:hypothetical protein